MIFSFLSTFLVLLFVFFIGTVICFGMRTITIPFLFVPKAEMLSKGSGKDHV